MRFDFCNECGRRCCAKGEVPVPVSDRELKVIIEECPDITWMKVDGLNYLIRRGGYPGVCSFLGDNGCLLSFKPVVCGLFPFQPTKKGWVLRADECPQWELATSDDLKNVKLWFESRKEDYRDR